MPDSLIFKDLVGPNREPTPEEDSWLAALAAELETSPLTVPIAPSCAAEDPEPVLRWLPGEGWRAGRYVGEVRRDGRVLEIQPRLGIDTIAAWAGAALNVRIIPMAAEHGGTAPLIAALLAASWRSSLVDAARHGPPGLRRRRAFQSEHVRGRIDVPATLKLRVQRRPQLVSVARPKLIDNPVSRSIMLADRVLDRGIARTDWRGDRAEEVLSQLRSAVGTRPELPSRREMDRVRYTPITLPYRRVAELSWRIARHRGLRAAATGESAEGLLIDVAELWELFLVHCARQAFGAGAVTHGTHLRKGRRLLTSTTNPADQLGRMYPDLLIGPEDHPVAVIDAKYKPLADPRGVDPADLYQLNAYLTGYPWAPRPRGMLAYTRFPGQVAQPAPEALSPWRTRDGCEFRFERLPVQEEACVAALESYGSECSDFDATYRRY